MSISQRGYIKNLITKYNLENVKSVEIPMQLKLKLQINPSIEGENQNVDKTKYQELIGSLLHLAIFSRPDICCSVNILSQFNQEPRKQHWNAAISI